MRYFFIIIAFFVGISSCVHTRYFNAHPSKVSFNEQSLKIEGAYTAKFITTYSKDSIGYYLDYGMTNYGMANNKKRVYQKDSIYSEGIRVLFLYANGIVRDNWLLSIDSLRTLNKSEYYKKNAAYGGYKIVGDSITISSISYMPGLHWCPQSYYGKIINDSTIFIYGCFIKDRKDYCKSDFYLHYTKIPKPDSTNKWMKRNWYWQ